MFCHRVLCAWIRWWVCGCIVVFLRCVLHAFVFLLVSSEESVGSDDETVVASSGSAESHTPVHGDYYALEDILSRDQALPCMFLCCPLSRLACLLSFPTHPRSPLFCSTFSTSPCFHPALVCFPSCRGRLRRRTASWRCSTTRTKTRAMRRPQIFSRT